MTKNYIDKLNKAFESRVRLGLMSVLAVNAQADFNMLKEMLSITDGNLASHISALEKEGYLVIHKQFIGKKPNTSYSISKPGKRAFNEHLEALEEILKQTK